MSRSQRICHKGHRDRVREKVLKFGASSLADHEIIEGLLFFCLPRVNTNEIAHHILEEAGSLEKIPELDHTKILNIPGIGKETLFFFTLISEFLKRIVYASPTPMQKFDSMSKVNDFLLAHYAGIKEEQFCGLLLDGQLRLLKFEVFSKGSISAASVDPRAIAYEAVKQSAAYVIIAHNHPGGYIHPSLDDLAVTEQIRSVLSAIGVSLIEHVIVGENICKPTMSALACNPVSPSRENGTKTDHTFFDKFYK
jgi:DNA repair protein RadC